MEEKLHELNKRLNHLQEYRNGKKVWVQPVNGLTLEQEIYKVKCQISILEELLGIEVETPGYEEMSKFLIENGWETWYNDDNWVKTEWIKNREKVDWMGRSTKEVYKMLNYE